MPDSDISFISSGRPSVDHVYQSFNDNLDSGRTTPRVSNGTDMDLNGSFESMQFGWRSVDNYSLSEFSSFSQDSDKLSSSSQAIVRTTLKIVH